MKDGKQYKIRLTEYYDWDSNGVPTTSPLRVRDVEHLVLKAYPTMSEKLAHNPTRLGRILTRAYQKQVILGELLSLEKAITENGCIMYNILDANKAEGQKGYVFGELLIVFKEGDAK